MIEVNYKKNKFIVDERSFQSLNSKGFGTKIDNLNFLDIYEATYLLEKKKIKIISSDKEWNIEDIERKKQFSLNEYLVYKDLKSKGYQVKSGFKYGFSFRVYDKGIKEGDDHSLWLVEILYENDKEKIKDFSAKNRIANTTRKKMLMAIVDNENNITYYESSWKRM